MTVEVLMAESDNIKSLNEESAIYKCKHCDNTFMKSKSLKKHMKKSHFRVESVEDENELQKNKVKFECKYCDNTFKKERNLNLHIREDHEDEDLDDESVKFDIKVAKVQKKSNECPECGIDYHIESELKRHMELRHAGENTVDYLNKEEASLEEKLLTQDDDETFMMENGSLDEVVDTSFDVAGDNEQDNVAVELDGESLSMEDIDFDFDATSENDSSDVSENAELSDEIADASVEEEQPVDDIVLQESVEFEFPVEQSAEDVHEKESVEVELPVDNVMTDSMEFDLDGESIVMDDAAFDMLENAMQMTMSTPDDSDVEDDVPLSNRKRKSNGKSQKKRGRPSKASRDDGEILLDGEAVVEDLETSATDDDDIVVVDEVNIVQNEESGSEDSQSEDDDPDFNPSSSFSKKEQPKRNIRPKRRETRKNKTLSTEQLVQITPMVKGKGLGRGRTRISVVPEARSVPIINSIPRSTRIVFNPGKSNPDIVDELEMKQSSKVKNLSTKKLLCSLCKNVFLTREKFNVHMMRDHHRRKSSVPSNSTPQSSKKSNPKTVEQMECVKCDGTFSKKTLLDDHIKSAHSHKCVKCRRNFDSKDSLKQHMQTHLVKCDKCNFAGESKQKVLDHKKAQHNFKCSKCRQAFDSKDKLDSHVKANHFFKCGKCNVIFDAKNLVDEHNKKSHYFPCTSCDKVFDMRQRLMTHDKTSHQSCDVCEDDFSWAELGHSCYYTKNNIRPVFK